MPARPITVLCVDDSPDIASLIELAISTEPDLHCAGCVHDASLVLEEIQRMQPAVVLLDLTMPGANPMQTLREIHARFPQTRVIVFSGYDDPATRRDAVDAGAWGFVSKHGEMDQLLSAIRQVADGKMPLHRNT